MRLNLPDTTGGQLVESILDAWSAVTSEDDPEEVASALEDIVEAAKSLASEAGRLLESATAIIDAVA